jgi:hypothetical protein
LSDFILLLPIMVIRTYPHLFIIFIIPSFTSRWQLNLFFLALACRLINCLLDMSHLGMLL